MDRSDYEPHRPPPPTHCDPLPPNAALEVCWSQCVGVGAGARGRAHGSWGASGALYRHRVGIAADLGYAIPARANPLQRSVRIVASSRPGAWALARTLPALDRVVSRLTRGRTTFCEQLSALPVLVVTTTGRRSGAPRPAQLIGVPVGGTLALLGTNFGQASTPTWVLNLEAEPRARVTHRDRTVEVVARAATPAERAEVLALAPRVYVGYARYLTRIEGRRVRVFVLEPA